MIADPNDGPRACSRCVHRYACPTPQACERAEQERVERASWRDIAFAVGLIAVLLVVILALNWS